MIKELFAEIKKNGLDTEDDYWTLSDTYLSESARGIRSQIKTMLGNPYVQEAENIRKHRIGYREYENLLAHLLHELDIEDTNPEYSTFDYWTLLDNSISDMAVNLRSEIKDLLENPMIQKAEMIRKRNNWIARSKVTGNRLKELRAKEDQLVKQQEEFIFPENYYTLDEIRAKKDAIEARIDEINKKTAWLGVESRIRQVIDERKTLTKRRDELQARLDAIEKSNA